MLQEQTDAVLQRRGLLLRRRWRRWRADRARQEATRRRRDDLVRQTLEQPLAALRALAASLNSDGQSRAVVSGEVRVETTGPLAADESFARYLRRVLADADLTGHERG